MLTTILGFLAVAVSIVRSWPQAVRIVTHRTAAGVSVLTWSIVFACGTTWVAWGIGANVIASAISNAAVALGAVAILSAIQRERGDVAAVFLKVVAFIAAIDLLALLLFGLDGVGVIAVATSIVMFLPQAWTALRADIAGVSPLAWTLILLSSLLWGVYGFVIDELMLTPGTFVIVPAALVVLLRVAQNSVRSGLQSV